MNDARVFLRILKAILIPTEKYINKIQSVQNEILKKCKRFVQDEIYNEEIRK